MLVLETLLLMGAAYLLGAIPFSYLVAQAQGVDLRTVGSGNIGAGNVWRACGFRAFLVAITLDILKGTVIPLVSIHGLHLPPLAVVSIGACAMIGHTFPVFLGFKGGKAVATGGGVLLAIFPLGVLAGTLTWFLIVSLVRITSVGSLSAAALAAILALTFLGLGKLEAVYAIFICLAAGAVIVLHRTNIQRLLAGTENRVQKLF